MSDDNTEAIKQVLLEETEKCRNNKDYANKLLMDSGIYNEDGTLNKRFKEQHDRISEAVQSQDIDAEIVDIVNNNFWDLL